MRLPPVKVAVIDLYNNEPNQGMRCIKEIVGSMSGLVAKRGVTLDIYETRYRNETPSMDYDIYISTGGPGSPFDGEGKQWEKNYFNRIEQIWEHNQNGSKPKKYVFFICHSFQIMARLFKFASVQKRAKQSFGIIPVAKTDSASSDQLFSELPSPFYAADFRLYEVIEPNNGQIASLNGSILAKEAKRIDPNLEKATMAVRLSDQFIGTQFHPEADPISMLYHFRQPERKKQVVEEYGEERYYEMLAHLEDPENILLTRSKILPVFLTNAIKDLTNDMYDEELLDSN